LNNKDNTQKIILIKLLCRIILPCIVIMMLGNLYDYLDTRIVLALMADAILVSVFWNKRWIRFVLVFVPLIALSLRWGIVKIQDDREKAAQQAAWDEAMLQKADLDSTIEDVLKEKYITDGRDSLTVDINISSHSLKSGDTMYFWNYKTVATFNSFSGFNSLSDKEQYETILAIRDDMFKTWYSVEDKYDHIIGNTTRMRKLTGHCVSPSFSVTIIVNCGGDKYHYYDRVLWKNSDIIYSENGPAVQEKESTLPKKPANSGSGTAKETYNNLITDPDDYDDPDDYAEDAWGVDFDDYDEAYEFWENW